MSEKKDWNPKNERKMGFYFFFFFSFKILEIDLKRADSVKYFLPTQKISRKHNYFCSLKKNDSAENLLIPFRLWICSDYDICVEIPLNGQITNLLENKYITNLIFYKKNFRIA